MTELRGATDGWWQTLYDDHLADILLEREGDPEDVVSFLVERLGLGPGDRVFDQCCGIASVAVPLAVRGFEVVGCDLIERYVARGRDKARAAGVAVELHASDAFEFVPAAPCDGAFNWWTGFGYAREDDTNLRMLQRAWDALKTGKWFALDTMNVPGVIRGFRPRVVTERGGVTLVRESELDVDAGLLHKRWSYTLADGSVVEHESTVRMHTPWELRALLHAAGFEHVELLGDVNGSPLTVESPRCIALARKGAT